MTNYAVTGKTLCNCNRLLAHTQTNANSLRPLFSIAIHLRACLCSEAGFIGRLHSGGVYPVQRFIKKKILLLPALVAATTLATFTLAQAQTATGSMGVSAQVTRTCTLSASSLAFGDLSTTEVNRSTANISMRCNGTSTVTDVLIGMGGNADGKRQMTSGDNVVPYSLHVLETGGADIATEGAVTLVNAIGTNTYSAEIHGHIQPSTEYQMGSYTDTVVLTAVYAP